METDAATATVANGGDDDEATKITSPQPSTPSPIKKKPHKKRKASNGRFKKLWRRAITYPGMSSREEWLELIELHSEWKARQADDNGQQQKVAADHELMMGQLPGPFIGLTTQQQRDFGNIEEWQTTEGSDHRDLLMNLLFRRGTADDDGQSAAPKKKRKKQTAPKDKVEGKEATVSTSYGNMPPMPSWATVGNLASVGGVAIIEVNIEDGGGGDECALMPSELIKSSTSSSTSIWNSLIQRGNGNDNTIRRAIEAACKVKLFQGGYPRSLSEVLMFVPPPPPSDPNKNTSNGLNGSGHSDLFRKVHDLRLTPKKLKAEGFPMEVHQRGKENQGDSSVKASLQSSKDKICTISAEAMQTIACDDALQLVDALSVGVEFGRDGEDCNNDKEDEYEQLEHYVKTFDHDSENKDKPKIFAIDCEMVQTTAGAELARVSVIVFVEGGGTNEEEKSTVVMDELVKPRRKILDYLTGELCGWWLFVLWRYCWKFY